jgi:hypothetical protein
MMDNKNFDHKGCTVVLCLLACFWIAAIALGVSVWPETVMGVVR